MLFNSAEFIFAFFPITFAVFWLLPKRQYRLMWLTVASYVFYGYWDFRFMGLMLLDSAICYYCGQRIARTESPVRRKVFLILSLVGCLGILAYFKYADFFLGSVNAIAQQAGLESQLPMLGIILPIGISFYTFQALSYTIDIYRREANEAPTFIMFASYVSMFPQLIAGPIVRYVQVADQLENLPDRPGGDRLSKGIWFFVMGLAKKVLVADVISRMIDPMFADYASLGLVQSWAVVLGYTVQIYFDFAGYSDMAVGLGHFIGLQMPQNFNSPYKATSISDFWRRWHISLSTWLRDYLFIPLGGSRSGVRRTLINLMIVMFLGGLWHGATWGFVIWGLYHGALLAGHATFKQMGGKISWAPVSRGLTFLAVIIGWAIFRTADPACGFGMTKQLFASMAGLNGVESLTTIRTIVGPRLLGFTGLALVWCFVMPNTWDIQFKPSRRWAVGTALMFFACVLLLAEKSPFLYFQF